MSIRSPRRWLLAVAVVASAAAPGRAAEPNDDDLDAFQKKVLNRMLHGNPTPDELRGLVDEMNKMMRKRFPDMQPFELPAAAPAVRRGDVPAVGALGLAPLQQLNRQAMPVQPAVPRPGRVRAEALPPAPADENAEASDKQLKEFDEAIERLKDNPEAQAELRKARDEYKKALAEGLRKNGGNVDPPREERRLPDLPREVPFVRPPAAALPRIGIAPLFNDPALRFDRAELVRPNGPVRLGVVFEKPPAVLAEQLDLPAQVGVVIVEVQAGSAAEKAGLRKHDVVVSIAGQDAPSELTRFQAVVAGLKAGEKLDVVLYRKGKKETVKGLELPAARGVAVEE
jgi:PDZ domain